jgi:hypothetical protein
MCHITSLFLLQRLKGSKKGPRSHPPHLLSSKGPKYQRGVLIISVGAIEGHFEGKTPREIHQGGLVFTRQSTG